jgi:hypothetical protein
LDRVSLKSVITNTKAKQKQTLLAPIVIIIIIICPHYKIPKMVRYGLALAFLVSQQALFRGQTSFAFAFQPVQQQQQQSTRSRSIIQSSRSIAVHDEMMNPDDSVNLSASLQAAVSNVTTSTTSYLDSLSEQAAEDDRTEAAAGARRERVLQRLGSGMVETYKVTLPLSRQRASTTAAKAKASHISATATVTLGICIGQVAQGGSALSDWELDLDTLQILDATQKSFESSGSAAQQDQKVVVRMDVGRQGLACLARGRPTG